MQIYPLVSSKELAGFALFLWLVARKRKTGHEET